MPQTSLGRYQHISNESSGPVIWITGYSGAGKTTVSIALLKRLKAVGRCAVLLDGDRLRAAVAPNAGHEPEERLALAMSYARLCKEFSEQGLVVVCATISMFDDVWAWNRAQIPKYFEVYLRVPLEIRSARDAKGLYASRPTNMVGLDLTLPEPPHPHLTIDNFGDAEPDIAAACIFEHVDRLLAGLAGCP